MDGSPSSSRKRNRSPSTHKEVIELLWENGQVVFHNHSRQRQRLKTISDVGEPGSRTISVVGEPDIILRELAASKSHVNVASAIGDILLRGKSETNSLLQEEIAMLLNYPLHVMSPPPPVAPPVISGEAGTSVAAGGVEDGEKVGYDTSVHQRDYY